MPTCHFQIAIRCRFAASRHFSSWSFRITYTSHSPQIQIFVTPHFRTLSQYPDRLLPLSSGLPCSKSNAGRRKGSEEAAYCKPSDVIIIGTSFAAENTLKIKFAILHPSVKGQPPKVANPEEVVEMVKENKEIIEKELGGKIKSVYIKGKTTKGLT